MLTCPNCRNRVPAWKLLLLTHFNTTACPTCSARLGLNEKIGRLIGGIGGGLGGGIGALLGISWVETKDMSYIMLFVAFLILLFFASWLAEIRFMKLEVRS